ncbi:MAG: KUP/HAK/KT family potassium transporter [Microscillaceae bacterium]|nr:KUP/HAK/KT family potassium transporter [Microscillaceae bacterium]MDW8461921.1 KUP/HAK/KT family potassium transporter [Cytophagales bacterium]
MSREQHNSHAQKLSLAGLLVTLGIIYGDIGTSPLYVMKAIVGEESIDKILVYGGISCVFWTLTLQTTIKYVVLTLRADNNGEGGIFSLYTLIRRRRIALSKNPAEARKRQLTRISVVAMIGGAALLADGIITPPISVSSAIEGLRILDKDIPTVSIVIAIISAIFLFQQYGTAVVGSSFGPIMFIWFTMLAVLGLNQIIAYPQVLQALNPLYAYLLITQTKGGFWLLGAVFLCTTGAEALYSDLGHCGRRNIRISWIYVKTCLILNYFGQGAWLMQHVGQKLGNGNPFYLIMPAWFLYIGITIATLAAIIASQALITGSFTLVGEAIRLNMWPKVKLNYPSNTKGQLYVPSINWLLMWGCIGVVLLFKESSAMEAAYGLAITITMLMTTILFTFYLWQRLRNKILIFVFLAIYLTIEVSFLVANLVKFMHGGYVTLFIGGLIAFVMWIWLKATEIKARLTEYEPLEKHIRDLERLSKDKEVPQFATNLVFMTSAEKPEEIDKKIIYSIFQKQPKRADVYWFIHVDVVDKPYNMEYHVKTWARDDVYKITFRLGFREEQRINLFFRIVVEELVKTKEVNISSRYKSLENRTGDFRFVVIERFLSYDNELPFLERFVMNSYFFIKEFTPSEEKWFGLDTSSVVVEKVPLIIRPADNRVRERLKRIQNLEVHEDF